MKKPKKKPAFVSWWERDDEVRRTFVSAVLSALSSTLHEIVETRKIEAETRFLEASARENETAALKNAVAALTARESKGPL